jgi:hypothetical protein
VSGGRRRALLALGAVVGLSPVGKRVTHRVVEVDAARNLLPPKGDANAVADPLPYVADRVDLVLFSVPAGGYVLAWSSGPIASMVLGAHLVFLLWVLWPRSRRVASGLLVVVGLGLAGDPRSGADARRLDGRRAGQRHHAHRLHRPEAGDHRLLGQPVRGHRDLDGGDVALPTDRPGGRRRDRADAHRHRERHHAVGGLPDRAADGGAAS